MRIDLHAHTTASDSTATPRELVAGAVESGLDVVAITDHDTTAGWAEAEQATRGASRALTLIRGMEWSCDARAEGDDPARPGEPVSVHLLCYLFDPDDPAITAETERLRAERTRRLRVMAERMAADGLPVDPDALFSDPDRVPGRPHLARALVEAGVVEAVPDAFTRLLSKDSPYYERKRDTPLADAVRAVSTAGGVAVIAHPRARTRGRLMAVDQIVELAGQGLGGVEVDHPDHAEDDRVVLRRLAGEHGLLMTGSSDFHGANKTVRLGQELTDPGQYEALVSRARGVGPVVGGGNG